MKHESSVGQLGRQNPIERASLSIRRTPLNLNKGQSWFGLPIRMGLQPTTNHTVCRTAPECLLFGRLQQSGDRFADCCNVFRFTQKRIRASLARRLVIERG
jgi:hypothetical protein